MPPPPFDFVSSSALNAVDLFAGSTIPLATCPRGGGGSGAAVQLSATASKAKKQTARVREHAGRPGTTVKEHVMDNTTAPMLARASAGSGGTRAINSAAAWYEERVARARATGRFAEFGSLTPAIAEVLMEHNPQNRAISILSVERWVAALRAGDWQENGETVKIAITGELNDGQHRCLAVLKTGISMPVLFAFGLPRESRKTVDVGAKRTAGHMLGMDGVHRSSLVASAIKQMLNIEGGVSMATGRSAQEIERALKANPGILEDSANAVTAARRFHQSTGAFVALHYLLARRHPQKAHEFFQMLAEGTAPEAAHPIARLSSRLTENLGAKAKLPATETAALVIKAMQAFVAGRSVGTLRWTSKGSEKNGKQIKPEPFPKVP